MKNMILLVILIVGFILGWVFPIEGPVDYIYDNYKVQKCAVKNGPSLPKEEILSEEELNFEEEEYALRVLTGDEE